MSDSMSREDAIDCLATIYERSRKGKRAYHNKYQEAFDMAIEALSAEPERKTGRWIKLGTDVFVCSECRGGYRNQPTLMGEPMFEYCPVCGAKMEVEHETD